MDQKSVDRNGNPIPWWPFAATRYLKHIVKSTHMVFEYGSGFSTLWWRKMASKVVSIEHDPQWFGKIKQDPKHVYKLIKQDAQVNEEHYHKFAPFFDAKLDKILINDEARSWRAGLRTYEFKSYTAELYNYPKEHFDIIVVDGMARVMCAWVAAQMIRPNGMIIMDDAERDMYRLAYELLARSGFKRIDFWGPKPIVNYQSCTSVFIRDTTMLR